MMMGVSSSTMVALIFFSCVLIAAQITFSPLFTFSSSSFLFQPPPPAIPEKTRGKIREERNNNSLPTHISCDRTQSRYDLCNISGPTVMDPTWATFYVMGPKKPTVMETIKPYPRKFDSYVIDQIKNVTLISGPPGPKCQIHHHVPALVFSAAGYSGNFWHDFNDGLIPLFITVNTIFRDRDFVIVISDGPRWWHTRYADILNVFSKHPIITLRNDTSTHCFSCAHFGLITHGFMTINQTLMPNRMSYLNFRHAMHEAYGHHHDQNLAPKKPVLRPRIVLASRRHSTGRRIVNERRVIRVMREVGFEVVVFEPNSKTPLYESYALIDSSHGIIGVHGAALTHAVFLRPGAVFMQIVPIGIEWASDAFFGNLGRGMNLEYMEYRIKVGESTLARKYGKNNVLVRNPFALQKNGWPAKVMDIYLKKQNVKLDLVRFRAYLKEAYNKAVEFMHKDNI